MYLGGFCMHWFSHFDFLSIIIFFFTQTSKKDEKRNGDIIPPIPFYMRPTGLTLYMRQKLGSAVIQKGARSSNSPINIKNIPKPTGVCERVRERERERECHSEGAPSSNSPINVKNIPKLTLCVCVCMSGQLSPN